MYVRQSNGRVYKFTSDTHDASGFAEVGAPNVHSDGFRTVAKWDLDDGEGVAFGEGESKNPDRAEAYIHFDAQNTTPAAITGRVKFVVLNNADEVVGEIYQNRLSRLRKGDPDTDARGSWGVPFPYQAIREGKGEVLGDGGYQIGIQIETDSGTDTFSLSDSSLTAEGFSGSVQN